MNTESITKPTKLFFETPGAYDPEYLQSIKDFFLDMKEYVQVVESYDEADIVFNELDDDNVEYGHIVEGNKFRAPLDTYLKMEGLIFLRTHENIARDLFYSIDLKEMLTTVLFSEHFNDIKNRDNDDNYLSGYLGVIDYLFIHYLGNPNVLGEDNEFSSGLFGYMEEVEPESVEEIIQDVLEHKNQFYMSLLSDNNFHFEKIGEVSEEALESLNSSESPIDKATQEE